MYNLMAIKSGWQYLDPRYFQIIFLALFLVYALTAGVFELRLEIIISYIAGALVVQLLGDCLSKKNTHSGVLLSCWNWKSALITSLSLCLLLRVPNISIALLASSAAILSKFIFKVASKHVFNPANFSIVTSVLVFGAWISPAQWGNSALLLLLFAGLGFVVTTRVARAGVAVIFLTIFGLLVMLRGVYLGDPLSISIHQMKNSALYLFAFFMITDPRTSPNHYKARILYAIALAVLSFYFTYYLHLTQGMLYALVITCSAVPLINRYFKAKEFRW